MTHTAETLAAAFGYLTADEVAALKFIAQTLPDNPVVVNIGAGSGTSGLAFMESRGDLFLITIDIEGGDSPLGSLYSERLELERAGFSNIRYHQILGDSRSIGEHAQETFDILVHQGERLINVMKHYLVDGVKTRFADMVFIDADHSYEACKGDILAWLPNIKPGGIIALHDYRKQDTDIPTQEWPGVDKAVDELLMGEYEQVLRVDSLVAFRV